MLASEAKSCRADGLYNFGTSGGLVALMGIVIRKCWNVNRSLISCVGIRGQKWRASM